MVHRRLHSRLVLLALLAIASLSLLAGCDDDPLSPFEPEVTNMPDSFQLQATGVTNRTLVRTYSWLNSGASGDVNQATTVSRGSATLSILDDAGQTVYSGDLADNGTFTTAAGDPGTWTIRLELDRYSGTLNFRVQTP
jgi:hypothetical protein